MKDEEKELMFFILGERSQNFVFPTVSAAYKKRIHQAVVIIDLKGVNVMKTFFKMKSTMQIANKISADYYPETLKKLIIAHSGRVSLLLTKGLFFKSIWKFIKTWMDPATQEKIVIENGSASKLTKKLIGDPEKIPKFLKGANTTSVMNNPGAIKKVLKKMKQKGLVFAEDDHNLRKYFWDVDMADPNHLYGVKEVKSRAIQKTER